MKPFHQNVESKPDEVDVRIVVVESQPKGFGDFVVKCVIHFFAWFAIMGFAVTVGWGANAGWCLWLGFFAITRYFKYRRV